jgi:hypothetical protein
MDEIVLRGMAKWPNVPAVYGWLSLDRRGNWLIKGERIPNPLVTEFIGRNYARDERGCWYFQNGPQRVFVNLDYTPFVYRVVSPDGAPLALEAHNGKAAATVSGAWMDENGALILETDVGVGVMHDHDLDRLPPHFVDANGNALPEAALDALVEEAGHGGAVPLWLKFRESNVRVEPLESGQAANHFHYVAQPVPPEGEEVCR